MAREEIEVNVTKEQLELLKNSDIDSRIIAITDDNFKLDTNAIKIGYKNKNESELLKGRIIIGHRSFDNGRNGIAIGNGSIANENSIAIGHKAACNVFNTIQIGTGFNQNEGTAQINDTTILNADGKIPVESLDREMQDKLISGENIKTINGNSLLGSGDITFQVQLYTGGGLIMDRNKLRIKPADVVDCKLGIYSFIPITPVSQHAAAFYGLAKAAGDTTQATSDNPIGTYTDEAKASIQEMLGIDTIYYELLTSIVGGVN